MSVKVSSWVWHGDETSELAGNEMILLLALADVADDNGRCRYMAEDDDLTYATLAVKSRVSRSTVIRIVARLREEGLVEHVKGVKGRPNEFRVLVPWAAESGVKLEPNGVSGGQDSVSTATDSVSTATVFGVTADTHSSINVFNVTARSSTSPAKAATTPGRKFAGPLCEVLVAELLRNEAKVPERLPKKWLDDARLLVDADGRDPHQAKALIEWACRDSFWRSNILSMPTFRKQYDKLRLARERQDPKRSTLDIGRETHEILKARAAARERQSVTA